jgi:hypothetical protein
MRRGDALGSLNPRNKARLIGAAVIIALRNTFLENVQKHVNESYAYKELDT